MPCTINRGGPVFSFFVHAAHKVVILTYQVSRQVKYYGTDKPPVYQVPTLPQRPLLFEEIKHIGGCYKSR